MMHTPHAPSLLGQHLAARESLTPADHQDEERRECCDGGGLVEILSPRLDRLDPDAVIDERRCGGCPACEPAGDGDHVECFQCGWDDGGDLVVVQDPVMRFLHLYGDEGAPVVFCGGCDEPLDAANVRVVERWAKEAA